MDFSGLVQLLMALGQQKSEQMGQLLPALTTPTSKIIRRDMSGNIINPTQPRPRGLDAFYANNPQLRAGEFDPTGRKSNARRSLGFARQDALGDMKFRNEYATGLLNLANTMGQLPKDTVDSGLDFGRHLDGVFSPFKLRN